MIKPGQVPAHFKHQHRQSQNQSNPEPAGHVRKLCGWPIIQAHLLGLQSHTTDGAVSRSLLANFGMHRAGVDGARRHGLFLLRLPAEVLFGVLVEFRLAA